MKKQTKSKKIITSDGRVVVNVRRQKFLAFVALAGLFLCGLFVGMAMRVEQAQQNNPQHVVNVDGATPACEVVENMLLGDVLPDGVVNWDNLDHNVNVYKKLAEYGCPENADKYGKLIGRETQIVAALRGYVQKSERNCMKIEDLLNRQLNDSSSESYYNHMENAKIYANLSERGCPENRQKYVELAKRELEIARALQDDNLNNNDTIEVVETYKRIHMQAAAQEILDKAKKLTNPAIDFIIELEKIINE